MERPLGKDAHILNMPQQLIHKDADAEPSRTQRTHPAPRSVWRWASTRHQSLSVSFVCLRLSVYVRSTCIQLTYGTSWKGKSQPCPRSILRGCWSEGLGSSLAVGHRPSSVPWLLGSQNGSLLQQSEQARRTRKKQEKRKQEGNHRLL